jgi:hypothetical protein
VAGWHGTRQVALASIETALVRALEEVRRLRQMKSG